MTFGEGQPLGLVVYFQTIAIRMIIRSDKVDVWPTTEKSQHKLELVWQIKVIVFCEIDVLRISLRNQDLHLLCKSGPIAYAITIYDDKIFRCKVAFEKGPIFLAAIENGPDLHPNRAE